MNMYTYLLFIFIVFETLRTEGKNYHENNLMSITLDFSMPNPNIIHRAYTGYDSFEISVSDRDHLKIGIVQDHGVQIYSDSDVLIYRKVIKIRIESPPKQVVQIMSIYSLESGKIIKEVLEFGKNEGELIYRELIKEPIILNVNHQTALPNPNILISLHNNAIGETNPNSRDLEIYYKTRNKYLYLITIIKYDDIIIDNTINVLYKNILMTYKGNDVFIEVNKITKNGEYINNKCKMIFQGENTRCEQVEINKMDIL